MKLGVIGLPNVGKSTLFNAITQAGAQAANYPFCTIEPNVGVVAVPGRWTRWSTWSAASRTGTWSTWTAASTRSGTRRP